MPVQFPSAGVQPSSHIAVVELWTRSLTCPCVQRQVPVAQFNKVVDVPVIMRVEVPQIQFIAGIGGHSSSQQRQVLDFQQWSFGGDDGFFDAFCVIFRAPPVVPELSASFRSPRWRRVLCRRGLPCQLASELCRYRQAGVLTQV